MVREAKDQTATGLDKVCAWCRQEVLVDAEFMDVLVVLDNNGHRFVAHKGCWWDWASDQYEDQMLERNQRDEDYEPEREPPVDELIMTQKEEIAYERFLDAMGSGGSL